MPHADTNTQHPYALLSQDMVMDAVESLGFYCDARVLPLNSYENRVYQVGIEDQLPLIAKFYRPGRWTKACIQEEHDFLLELQQNDLPVVAPVQHQGRSLFEHEGFYFALFPRRGGHAPELSNDEDLELLGRWLARLHQAGARRPFVHRPVMQGAADLRLAQQQVIASGLLPDDYHDNYLSITNDLIRLVQQRWQECPHPSLRLHGDLHTGNLLLRDELLYMVDFDDCLQGPAMQDIWMLLSGNSTEQQQQLLVIQEGYEMFRPLPLQELPLIEVLRTLRLMKYAAWLCTRWDDPAFPLAFTWFGSHRFWSEHLLALREQIAALQEPALTLYP